MVYGCSGGDLDESLDINYKQAASATVKNVSMTWLVKYSKNYQDNPDSLGARRFAIIGGQKVGEEVIADASYKLYDPKNLADFINWNKKTYSAHKYILILWNHGGGWDPLDDAPKTKGVIYDDNLNDVAMSVNEVVEGVKLSGVKLDVIYYDSCLIIKVI